MFNSLQKSYYIVPAKYMLKQNYTYNLTITFDKTADKPILYFYK